MNIDGQNPCNICKSNICDGCILDSMYFPTKGTCYRDLCMLNYEGGCLISIDDVCKASTAYVKENDE